MLADANAAEPLLWWVTNDHLGRPVLMTDSSQAVVWRAAYRPFGEVISVTGPASLDARFPGQWFQLESGLAYNWHRHYDASIGRYTQADPLGVKAGPSVFGYAGGNPVMGVDPSGLMKLPIDPSLLPPGWNHDPTHLDPNGMRFKDRAGNTLDFHQGRPGSPGFRGKNHWHYNQCDDHLMPGDDVPDPLPPLPRLPRLPVGPLILIPTPVICASFPELCGDVY